MATSINVLDFIPAAQHAAIFAGNSLYDATSAIQAALDDSSPRKIVTLPPGQLAISTHLFPHNDTSVEMDRCNLFQLGTAQGGHPTASAFWIEGVYNWSIRGGRIDGNYANRSASGESCIIILNSGEFKVENLKCVHAPCDGIALGYNNPGDPNSYTQAGIFDNVNCEANVRHGFSFDGVRDIKLINCRARSHTLSSVSSGYACEPSSAAIQNDGISLLFCEGIGNSRYGIYASSQTAGNGNVRVVGSGGFKGNSAGQIGQLAGASISVTC